MKTIVPLLKITWSLFWLSLITLVLFIPIFTVALLGRSGILVFEVSKSWAWAVNTVHFITSSIRGREKIKQGQAYVIVSNHQSHMDIPTIVTRLGIQFRWIIKKELLYVPLFGWALYASRNIFIDRSNREAAINTIRLGVKRLPPGVSLLFFAEGTRSPDGQIHAFKKGAFLTAIVTGFPILPITINGSRKVLPKGRMAFKPGRIEVVVGDPIDSSVYAMDQLESLLEKTRQTIVSNFNQDFG